MASSKIFPKDWIATRPYNTLDGVDFYYIELANKVIYMLDHSPVSGFFKDTGTRERAGMYFSMWLEDICSNIGVWRVVNHQCLKRYGVLLPFYDTSDYYEGEVNYADVSLLLWHFMQAHSGGGRLFNPENPALLETADMLTDLLEEEYEWAPENERLFSWINQPEATIDWWKCRNLIEWFQMSYYIFPDSHDQLAEQVQHSASLNIGESELAYMVVTEMMYNSRKNLLSLTTLQWLYQITGYNIFNTIERTEQGCYLYKGVRDRFMLLYDLVNEKEYKVELDSMKDGGKSLKVHTVDDTVLLVSLVNYDGRYYVSGMMLSLGSIKKVQKMVDEKRYEQKLMSDQKDNYPLFLEASKGEPVVVVKNITEVKAFFEKELNFDARSLKFPGVSPAPKCYAIYGDPVNGVCISPSDGECIAAPFNKYYKKTSAKKSAMSFYLNTGAVPYRVACLLHDRGYLPDAAINSLNGYEYGRDFLHDNANFFLDYFYHSTREQDFDPYFK